MFCEQLGVEAVVVPPGVADGILYVRGVAVIVKLEFVVHVRGRVYHTTEAALRVVDVLLPFAAWVGRTEREIVGRVGVGDGGAVGVGLREAVAGVRVVCPCGRVAVGRRGRRPSRGAYLEERNLLRPPHRNASQRGGGRTSSTPRTYTPVAFAIRSFSLLKY